MVSTCLELAKRWDERLGCEVDVLAEMGRLTARIIGRTIFGDDTTAAEAEQVVSGFARYQRSIEQLDYGTTSGVPALQALSRFLGAGVDTAAARDVHQVIDRIIGRHRTKRVSSDGANLLNQFLSETSSKEALVCPMSSAAVRNEAIVMFMAGHETTANTLAWVFYVIAAAPQFGAMLREELQRVLGHRLPSYEDVERLPLTRAIIEETLRLYPPVPLLSRQARGPDKLGKLDIRSGDIMLVVPWLLHRHELYWDGPNAFRPERFLPGAPRPDRYCYLPFSGGHRVCLGQRFGLTETILCLAILAQRFKWTLRSEHRVEVECRLTLRPAGGLPMRIDLVQP